MKKIALFGECMLELNGESFGEMVQRYGGDTLNTALYLARTSDPTAIAPFYITALGTDALSQQMKADWQKEGIHTDYVLHDEKRKPGLYLIGLDQEGERHFMYWRDSSAARYQLQHPDFSQVIEALKGMDMLYFSGISLAILPLVDRLRFLDLVKELKAFGVEIVFDSNYRPALWQSVEEAQEIYQEVYSLVDIALVTFDDEKLLWQDENPESTAQRLENLGVKVQVIKMGKDGAWLKTKHQHHHIPATLVTQVVDTTSAGDSFNAGFLNGYLQGRDLPTCCHQGHQLAGVVIGHKGAIIPKEATAHFVHFFNEGIA